MRKMKQLLVLGITITFSSSSYAQSFNGYALYNLQYVDYLVTEGGVCAYDGTTWTEYHVADGLVGPVIRALSVDSQSNIWIATSKGVSKLSDHQVSFRRIQQQERSQSTMKSNRLYQ